LFFVKLKRNQNLDPLPTKGSAARRSSSIPPICALLLASVTGLSDDATARSIDREHFKIIGLTLFKGEIPDIEQKLGPAEVFHQQGSSTPERCYTSKGDDRTVRILEDWTGVLIGFRIYRSSPASAPKCTQTPCVSAQISTAGGLRLGLTKAEVLKLLGAPTRTTGNLFNYHEDIRSQTKGKEGLWEYSDINLKFVKDGLISIHVVHTVRD
jgi:hypothetical protein